MPFIRMILFLLTVLFIIFGGHLLIYMTIERFLPLLSPLLLKGIAVAFILLPLLFIGASVIESRYNNLFTRTLYLTSSVWLGFTYFFLAASLATWIFYGLSRIAPIAFDMQWVMAILFTTAIGLAIFGLINANNTQTTRVSITVPGLPTQWKGRTAVWVSDLHLGQIYGKPFAQKISSMIKEEHPDVIFIGGDLYDGSAVDMDDIIRPLAQLTAPQGIYFINGNHEEFTPDRKFTDAVRRAGIHVLSNDSVIRDGVRILGVDFEDSETEDPYMQILEKLDTSYPTILLKHAPNNINITRKYPIALQLSGHTHDGQLWPLGHISSRVFHGFDKGLNQVDNLQVYTSVGVGTWGPPFRVGTNPEIVVITLE